MNIFTISRRFISRIAITINYEISFFKAKVNTSKYQLLNNKRKVFIFLAADYGNLGDIAITYAQTRLLAMYYNDSVIIEIPISETLGELKTIKKICKPDDIFTLIGGGNMGDMYYGIESLREFVIRKIKNNKIISFPQTIDFSETVKGREALSLAIRTFSKHPNLTLMARETKSYWEMKKCFQKNQVFLTPDVVMTLDYLDLSKTRQGVVLCMRNDKEKYLDNIQTESIRTFTEQNYKKISNYDTHIGRNNLTESERAMELDKLLREFSSAELVITDRLHGMIFCYVTGTPAIVFPNRNSKIEKSYEWIKNSGYILFSSKMDIEHLKNIASTVSKIKVNKDVFKTNKLYFSELIQNAFN